MNSAKSYAHIITFTITLALAPQLTIAQSVIEALSLQIYRQEVVDYSLSLKAAQVTIESSDATVAYKRVARLPQLLATGSYAHGFRKFETFKPWTLYVEPMIIQTIYNGGATKADIKQAELNREVAICDADYTMLEVAYTAEYVYWNLWSLTRYFGAMEQYVKLIRDEYTVIERRYNEGYIAKGDLLMLSSRLNEAEYELISAEQSMLVARYNLNILRGIKADLVVELAVVSSLPTSIEKAKSATLNDIQPLPHTPKRITIDEVLEHRPDYKAIQLSELAAAQATKAAKGAFNPKLYGGVAGTWRTFVVNVDGKTYLDGYIFAEFSMPIFHFGERKKAVAIARATERQTTISREVLYDAIISEESTAWTKLIESRAQMSNAVHSLNIASENLEISTYAYNEGEVSIIDLMQAQISWIQIYTNAINSEYNYHVAMAAYRLAVGEKGDQ